MISSLNPADRISLLFIVILLCLTITYCAAIPHCGWLVCRFSLLAAAIISAAVAASRKPSKQVSLLHALLPVFVVPVVFDSMGDIIPWVRERRYDEILIQMDYALFFNNHPTLLAEHFINSSLTTVLQFAYISYYPMAIVLGIVFLIKGKRAEFDEAVFGILLCFYLSYVGYFLVPAVGPRFTLSHLQTMDLQASPLVMSIQETLNRLENTKTDAFPSGHTAIALMTLYYALKKKEKVLTAVLMPTIAGLIASTVYLRYHYVVDVLAGIALTGFTIWLSPKVYPFFLRRSR